MAEGGKKKLPVLTPANAFTLAHYEISLSHWQANECFSSADMFFDTQNSSPTSKH